MADVPVFLFICSTKSTKLGFLTLSQRNISLIFFLEMSYLVKPKLKNFSKL